MDKRCKKNVLAKDLQSAKHHSSLFRLATSCAAVGSNGVRGDVVGWVMVLAAVASMWCVEATEDDAVEKVNDSLLSLQTFAPTSALPLSRVVAVVWRNA